MGLEIRDLALHAGPIVLQLLDFKKTWAYFVHNFFLHTMDTIMSSLNSLLQDKLLYFLWLFLKPNLSCEYFLEEVIFVK